jgi:SulP family sulfate permease
MTKNRFGLSEWSGAVGDLGTLLPLTFALVVYNGFPASRLFLLVGIVYVTTGWFYKVPVSVQPLKVMAVIALAQGFSIDFLTTTAFFYGILFILFSVTGILRWLNKHISLALVRGIQLGIGLLLAKKAIELVYDKGLLINHSSESVILNFVLFLMAIVLIWYFQKRNNLPIALFLIVISIPVVLLNFEIGTDFSSGTSLFAFNFPDFSLLLNGFILLIIPQVPLTLGNAVFAASESCHSFWGKQAERVNPSRLGLSIGISNVFIGLLGGFPICHGAGGMAAHAQFGGKTGGTTIIIGVIMIAAAILEPLTRILFMIPVPILGAMLLFDSWRLIILVKKSPVNLERAIALVVGIVSFLAANLAVALIIGILFEYGIKIFAKYQKHRTLEAMGYDQ